MARIAGINIPTNKRVEIALTYIHGIGLSSSKKICDLANITHQTRVNNLTEGELSKIRDIIDKDYFEINKFKASTKVRWNHEWYEYAFRLCISYWCRWKNID